MEDKGFLDQAMGKAKEAVGDLTGDGKMKAEGLADQAMGKAKEVAGDVSDAVGEVAQKAKDALEGK
ncbi:CsbD family protein [Stomatohabitans albus]|uniref:CsbD family protein n=1 Tax=Stomatohabitans albus TaxID=3110766 RepID=UPI00300D57D2